MAYNERGVVPIILIIYGCLLFFLSIIFRLHYSDFILPIWKLQSSQYILVFIRNILLITAGITILFIPLGSLTLLTLYHVKPKRSFPRLFSIGIISCCIGSILLLLFLMVSLKLTLSSITLLHLLLPGVGTFLGIILGMSWILRKNPPLTYTRNLFLIVGAIAFLSSLLVLLCFDLKPLTFQPTSYNSADKRALVSLVRNKDPRKFVDGQIQSITFTLNEINKLIAWGLDVGSGGRKAKVLFQHNNFTLLFSIPLPSRAQISPYCNIQCDGNVSFNRPIWIQIKKLKIGNIFIPSFIINPLFRSAYIMLQKDQLIQPVYNAIKNFSLSDSSFCIQYGKVYVSERFGSRLMSRFGASNPMASAIYAQLDQLVQLAQQTPDIHVTLKDCMEKVFSYAQKQSMQSNDPAMENQAAIFALAILVGYERIGKLVGPVTLDKLPLSIEEKFSYITIYSRADWTRHFLVSAALQLLSNIATSNAIGLLKEELDGDLNGSGFSFSDFCADRAGTTFATFAVRDSLTAATFQSRIISGFVIKDFFPEATDLPENIYDSEFQSVYGGVGGKKYSEILLNIENRVNQCSAYKGK
jgi:hypothetical protein